MDIKTITDHHDNTLIIHYGNIVPYDVSAMFTSCHRKITLEGRKPTDSHFSVALCTSVSRFGTAANLDEVATLFDTYQHDEETVSQAITAFINMLNRADLRERYELFKHEYQSDCTLYELDANIVTKPDIMTRVIEKNNINPKKCTQPWAKKSLNQQ